MLLSLLAACTPTAVDSDLPSFEPPDPADRPALRGPGGPTRSFAPEELFQVCATMVGAPEDRGYRNSVVPWRGHMLMPWAYELGGGGLSFWNVSDPCNPVHEHYGAEPAMRETHALGMVHLPEDDPHAGDWAVAEAVRGLVFWDMTELDDIHPVNVMIVDDVISLDSYARAPFNLVWQYPWVFFTATDNGLIILDATDPVNAFEAGRFQLEPPMRMGGIFTQGNRALVVSAGQTEAAMLDLSDPTAPQLVSRFDITDADGTIREAYSGNLVGDYAIFARKDAGAGPIVFDVSDPANPVFLADAPLADGGGGYVFWHEGFAFVGHGSRADVYDMTALPAIEHIGTGHLEGDLDTITPFGNIAVLAVDDEGVEDEESAIMPWRTTPDTTPPRVLTILPPDGATGVHPRSRISVSFDEQIEPTSAHAGSLRLKGPDGYVETWSGANETFSWTTPKEPLQPNTTYTFELMADGITDPNGNVLTEGQTISFTTRSN